MKLIAERVDTTVGELIAALSDAAFELCSDEKEAYLLVSLALEDILLSCAFRQAVFAFFSENGKRLPEERLARV
ncbi:MAG: hypothetical protein HYY46_00130 [Deltaproteobacteria bacterium]|nr:hypothetical protein [Deltaproteobacteria bacterium]